MSKTTPRAPKLKTYSVYCNVTKRRKPMSNLTPVHSSMIAAIGFTEEPPTIVIQFAKGQTWHYTGAGVTKTLYLSLKASESAGKFFLNNIKGKFQERRADAPKEETRA